MAFGFFREFANQIERGKALVHNDSKANNFPPLCCVPTIFPQSLNNAAGTGEI